MIQNPILRGFHPDPCVCFALGKYYLVTSTFEWFPGITCYESEDLLHWHLVGGLLNEIDLRGIPDSAGIWAPSLSFDGKQFYLVYTIAKQIDGMYKDVENYVSVAPAINGPWSSPYFLNGSGFDPDMYHENGRHYVVNPQWDARALNGHQKFNGIILQEYSFEKGMIGDAKVIYHGRFRGGAEGPHIFKKDHYYYLLVAEGGTGRHHSAVVVRSKNLYGPYQSSPYTPLLTSWEQPTSLKKAGHGVIISGKDHDFLFHLCARYVKDQPYSILGRETAMQEVIWEDGWPRLKNKTCHPELFIEGFDYEPCYDYATDFKTISFIKEGWLSLRYAFEQKVQLVEDGLLLRGGDSLTSLFDQSLIARRLSSLHADVEITMRYHPHHYQESAGLVLYYNTQAYHYLYLSYDEIGEKVGIETRDDEHFTIHLEKKITQEEVSFKAHIADEKLQFYVNDQPFGPVLDMRILSDEHIKGWAYTGCVYGLTCVDYYLKTSQALFTSLSYKERNDD